MYLLYDNLISSHDMHVFFLIHKNATALITTYVHVSSIRYVLFTYDTYVYQPAGHIVTGNLKIISDSRIRKIVSKGPKYRFPSYINFDKCREEISSALNDFGNRWCKREGVEDNALKEWKRSIFTIVDKRIKFYSQNTNLLPPKPKSSFRHLK